ncbi:MAG: AmmeMemoRadiSam system protein B [Clostridiales bacterium]|jgi:AmmeMemoRadiSam system protein B|nr:AmmeMemoRadiSam system protein B [Clostridiales bacterium]
MFKFLFSFCLCALLSVQSITENAFKNSIKNPREYSCEGSVRAGVLPHHLTAAQIISGFFELIKSGGEKYDTVIIVAPNHKGDLADIVVTEDGWNFGGNGKVSCDTELIKALLDKKGRGLDVIENRSRVETDHSASVLIPYVNYYLPNAEVATILVSRTMTLQETLNFSKTLNALLKNSEKNVLLLCSIDFSHYLQPREAMENNETVIEAMENSDYEKIHEFSNNYADSPAALIVFLEFLNENGLKAEILDNTDASEFIPGVQETTSYIVIGGVDGVCGT